MATATLPDARTISTIDALKLVAVVLMVADHVGLYLYDNTWLRVAGRPVAVIFGFLIGYSASTRVPPSWVGWGLALSLLNRWLMPDQEPHALDILVSLALTRIAMPFFDRLHAIHPMLLVSAAAALALLTEPVNAFLEYGTEVPILALLGTAVRLDRGLPIHAAARQATALAALVAICLIAIRHFEFKGWEAAVTVGLLALTMTALANFRRASLVVPEATAPLIQWIGRNTLLIYAVHVAALQIAAWYFGDTDAEDGDDDDKS